MLDPTDVEGLDPEELHEYRLVREMGSDFTDHVAGSDKWTNALPPAKPEEPKEETQESKLKACIAGCKRIISTFSVQEDDLRHRLAEYKDNECLASVSIDAADPIDRPTEPRPARPTEPRPIRPTRPNRPTETR